MQCFGRTKDRYFDDKLTNGGDKENVNEKNELVHSNSKRSLRQSNSEKEHNFLRAAHNGQLSKIKEAIDSGIMDVNSCNSNGLNALHLASKGGHLEVVKYLIEHGADIHAKTRKDNTALHIASLAGSQPVVELLVQNGASINDQSQNGFTALYMASQENHVGIVEYLLEHGANINLATDDHFTPLAVAIQQGNEQSVAVLLSKIGHKKCAPTTSILYDSRMPPLHIATRKDDYNAVLLLLHHHEDVKEAVNQTSTNGFTALHVAAFYNSIHVGRLLLENNAPVDKASKSCITALHVAAKWGNLDMVKLLLEFGANLESETREGFRPIHCAAREGHRKVVEHLVGAGAKTGAKTKNGLGLLHMVAQGNHADLVKYLITDLHADPNQKTLDYLSPLHFSSHCNTIQVGEALITNGADMNSRAMNGFGAIHIAVKHGHYEFVQMLINHQADINVQTEAGLSPLHIASIIGNLQLVELLVSSSLLVHIDQSDEFGRTALQLATVFDNIDVVRCLLKNGANVDWQNKIGETAVMIAVKRVDRRLLGVLLNYDKVPPNLSLLDHWGLSALCWSILIIRETSGSNDVLQQEAQELTRDLIEAGAIEVALDEGAIEARVSAMVLAVDCGLMEAVELLLEHGCVVGIHSGQMSEIHAAARNNHHDVLSLLREHLTETEWQRTWSIGDSWTPLHLASYYGSTEAMQLLLGTCSRPGDRIMQVTACGNTALHLAVQQMRADVVRVILRHPVDPKRKNNNGLTVFDMVKLIDDDAISTLFREKFGQINVDWPNNQPPVAMQREDPTIDEDLDKLLRDASMETEFYGVGDIYSDKCEIQKNILRFLDYTASGSDSIRRAADWSLKINESLSRYKQEPITESLRKHDSLLRSQPSSMFNTLSSTITYMDGFDVESTITTTKQQTLTAIPTTASTTKTGLLYHSL